MMVDQPVLTFAHISDSHINTDSDYTGNHVDFSPNGRVQRMVEHINNLPFELDFVLHTGDVMHDPSAKEDYRLAETLFSKLRYPIFYLSGNHDVAPMLKEMLIPEGLSAPQTDKVCYQFERKGVQIVCLDSSIPYTAHGEIDGQQMAWLEKICDSDDERPLIVAVHHHVIPIDVPWFDTMSVINGADVHDVLKKAQKRLRAVFYGHIHQNLHVVRDHIPYFSTLSAWFELFSWPGQENLHVDDVQLAGYSVVTLTERDTFVRQYRIAPDK